MTPEQLAVLQQKLATEVERLMELFLFEAGGSVLLSAHGRVEADGQIVRACTVVVGG